MNEYAHVQFHHKRLNLFRDAIIEYLLHNYAKVRISFHLGFRFGLVSS